MPSIGDNGDKGDVYKCISCKLVTSNYLTNAFYSKYDYKDSTSGVKVKYLEVMKDGEVFIYRCCMHKNEWLSVISK